MRSISLVLVAACGSATPTPVENRAAAGPEDPWRAFVQGARFELVNNIMHSTIAVTVARVAPSPGGRQIELELRRSTGDMSTLTVEVTATEIRIARGIGTPIAYPQRADWQGPPKDGFLPVITTKDGVSCYSNEQILDPQQEVDCGNCHDEVCVDRLGLVEYEEDLVASEGPFTRR